MSFFSKATILAAYHKLSTLSADPHTQGATQRVSTIRYAIALDMFYRQFGRECDVKDKKDALAYIQNVGKVVSINDSIYTSNFYYPLSNNSDFAVGSNFYSVNVVRESMTNGGQQLVFPRRGSNPIMYVKSGKLYEDIELLKNLSVYIPDVSHRIAFIIWLLRSTQIDESNIYNSVKSSLSTILTGGYTAQLLPSEEDFDKESHTLGLSFDVNAAKIEANDIAHLFRLSQTKSITSPSHTTPLQTIYFGSPGTGKSHKVKTDVLKEVPEEQIFRTTFHPDSDYASFVGCYKPVCHSAKGAQEASRISYEFSPQVFTKAYCKAWKNPDRQIYLVIEEINRGNCAQIFGDLFQLLDRKDGVSEYPIDADTDLRLYLETELAKAEDGETDGSRGIEGGKLSLPSNLNIIATMNTSDQSLFPMDSAFKRRWEWKYIPTAAPKGKDRQMELAIENTIETKDGRKINAGNYEYSWKDFLSKINDKILNVTHSEDKQLGYWFMKPDDGTDNISIGSFVSKVVFYLWNDVFKDMGARDTNPFTIKVNGKNELMSFNSFFEENTEGEVVENLGVLHTFLTNVGLTPEPVNPGTASAKGIESDAADEAENGDGASGEIEG